MGDYYTPLAVSDMAGIPEAIITLISEWSGLPFTATQKTVCWNDADFPTGIGCFPASGAVYLKRYLSGTFTGQIPVIIQYRVNPTTNIGRINSARVLDSLCEWLESCTAELEDSNTTIDKIERTSQTIKVGAYADGSEVYQNTFNIIYTTRRK